MNGSRDPASQDGADELERLRAAHTDLLRAISHDVRAPLRHITAFAPLLREHLVPAALPEADRAEALQFLATMEQAGQRMGRMLDGLLAISRAQAATLRCEPLDVARLVADEIATLAPGTDGRHIAWELGPAMAPVHADEALLRQLLHQLLSNAIKFSRDTPQARIAVQATREGNAWLLRVQDNGVGFDGTRAQGLFGLFQRMHPERAFDGVGAGLALVRTVAERHGGSVSAQATPGGGCCVQVRLPVI